jgi:allantoinase
VHVSTGRGVALVAEARARGVDATCETCPHYLVLDEEDAERLGATAKCAPPLRHAAEQEALWAALRTEQIAFVASDHSPAPADLKGGDDIFAAWGGISGCQSMLALILHAGHHERGLAPAAVATLTATAAARRLRLRGKGRLEAGADADVVLVDLAAEHTVTAGGLHYRHPHSPFSGMTLRGRVARTVLRGATVFAAGRLQRAPAGRLVTPEPDQESTP